MKSQLFYAPASTTSHLFIFSGEVRGPPCFLSKFLNPLSIPYTQEKPQEVYGKINSVSKSSRSSGRTGLQRPPGVTARRRGSTPSSCRLCLPNGIVSLRVLPFHSYPFPIIPLWSPTFSHFPSLSYSNHELKITNFNKATWCIFWHFYPRLWIFEPNGWINWCFKRTK